MTTLTVHAPVTPEAAWHWHLDDDSAADGSVTASGAGADATGSGLDALAERLADEIPERIVLLVPGERVLRTAVAVPGRNRRKNEAALPYLVEEYLAEDVERLHLAVGGRGSGGRLTAVAVAPALMDEWLAALAAHDLRPDSARVDVDAVDAGSHEVVVLLDDRRALVRAPAEVGFACERDSLEPLLTAICDGTEDSLTVRLDRVDGVDPTEELDLAQLDGLLARSGAVRVERRSLSGPMLAHLAAGVAPGGAADDAPELLQGAYAPRPRGGRRRPRWALVAGLALAWLLVELALDTGRAAWLEARAETLRDDAVAAFKSYFPDRTRVPDPRRELQAMVAGGTAGDGAGLLELLGAVAAGSRETDARIEVRSISFNARRGDMALDVRLSGIAEIDRLEAALEAQGHPVTIDSAVQEADGVRARLRIGAGTVARPGGGGPA